jgi:hypothetical protein
MTLDSAVSNGLGAKLVLSNRLQATGYNELLGSQLKLVTSFCGTCP